MFKEEKGITLVALVLTIVVLLVLTGVSIAVVIQNNNMLVENQKTGVNSSNNYSNVSTTNYDDAETRVKLIFELLEANYQTELLKGNVTDRSGVFTASNILEMLEEYNIDGNTEITLGEIDINDGITINYNNEYTFLVRVSDNGLVTVINK